MCGIAATPGECRAGAGSAVRPTAAVPSRLSRVAIRARPYVAIAADARTLSAWLRRCAHAAM
ncbi:hypothetical protein XAR_3848 [Xanthomonas citri pv. glycines str. 8ra]|nr:hypothetical protein XAR_3848 [Xanthomonas citri pv. glycines str. 8ra]